jgi:hypothetical protein
MSSRSFADASSASHMFTYDRTLKLYFPKFRLPVVPIEPFVLSVFLVLEQRATFRPALR